MSLLLSSHALDGETQANPKDSQVILKIATPLLHNLFFLLIAYVLTTTSSRPWLMWLNVIISLFVLPNQIKSGVLVSNQASFDFLTINTLFDH